MKQTVKCDNCDWKEEESDIPSWHNKQCPSCGSCIIITDDDLSLYNGILALEKMGIVKRNFTDEDEGILMTIDTASLRNPTPNAHE
jgi:NAD-dependent SIR2 family protein deacetylase